MILNISNLNLAEVLLTLYINAKKEHRKKHRGRYQRLTINRCKELVEQSQLHRTEINNISGIPIHLNFSDTDAFDVSLYEKCYGEGTVRKLLKPILFKYYTNPPPPDTTTGMVETLSDAQMASHFMSRYVCK